MAKYFVSKDTITYSNDDGGCCSTVPKCMWDHARDQGVTRLSMHLRRYKEYGLINLGIGIDENGDVVVDGSKMPVVEEAYTIWKFKDDSISFDHADIVEVSEEELQIKMDEWYKPGVKFPYKDQTDGSIKENETARFIVKDMR